MTLLLSLHRFIKIQGANYSASNTSIFLINNLSKPFEDAGKFVLHTESDINIQHLGTMYTSLDLRQSTAEPRKSKSATSKSFRRSAPGLGIPSSNGQV